MSEEINTKTFKISPGLNVRTILGFVISGFFLWLTFHNSGLRLQNLELRGLDLFYFIVSALVLILSVFICSMRLKLFWVKGDKTAGDIHTFDSLVIGNFYNCLLPGNLGEGMRAWHFSRKNGVPFIQSMSSVLAEKWIDAQYFAFLTLTLYLIRPFAAHFVSYTISYTASAVVVLLTVYLVMRYNKYVEKKLVAFTLLFKKPGKVFYRLYWFMAGQIGDLIKRKLIVKYLMYCSVVYVLNALQFLVLLKCAGVTGPVVSIYSVCLISLSMMIIAIIPSAPGNIGVLHYGIYSVLLFAAAQYGVHPEASDLLAYARFAVYVHLSYLIPEVIVGGICLIKERKVVFAA